MSKMTASAFDHVYQEESLRLFHRDDYREVVGMGTCGLSAGAAKVMAVLEKEISQLGLEGISLDVTGCIGMCIYEPIVEVYDRQGNRTTYIHVDPAKALDIATFHLAEHKPLPKYMLLEETSQEVDEDHHYIELSKDRQPSKYPDLKKLAQEDAEEIIHQLEEEPKPIELMSTDFFNKQKRIVLKNCGFINPEKIEDYLAVEGYQALRTCLLEKTPQQVIDTILQSGLRGRGGGGFPTGRKWQFAASHPSEEKYFICNADEGDPGAFMDRAVLEGDPHAVLEAMAIGGYAIGASQGYIYVRAEYPVAVKRLKLAIEQAKDCGFLGENILGSGFSFDVHLRLGAGAFVCGEETALMASIEGRRGMPANKPPFPAEKGLWGKPTIINNVETLANIAPILRKGPDWFRSFGTEASPGTKAFALGGKIKHTGLIEVPMGITLREIIYDIGGGCPQGKAFKAVQTGGPSGGCITTKNLDVPIDFDNLVAIGSMMGSGGMIVMDEDNCMVDIAKFFLDFTVDESCGQCVPCREGTKRMLEILDNITNGHGTLEDLENLEDLAQHIRQTSLCALGQTAPNPILSTLHNFKEEYKTHIEEQTCPCHVCKGLLGYYITENCKGCTKCVRYCPVKAISGAPRTIHHIDQDLCIRCGACLEGCVFGAIVTR